MYLKYTHAYMQKQNFGFGRSRRLHLKQDLHIKRLMTEKIFYYSKIITRGHTQCHLSFRLKFPLNLQIRLT